VPEVLEAMLPAISLNGGVPISIFKMDTIAKAENVAMALGLSSLLAI
jgi:hypothetical protein